MLRLLAQVSMFFLFVSSSLVQASIIAKCADRVRALLSLDHSYSVIGARLLGVEQHLSSRSVRALPEDARDLLELSYEAFDGQLAYSRFPISIWFNREQRSVITSAIKPTESVNYKMEVLLFVQGHQMKVVDISAFRRPEVFLVNVDKDTQFVWVRSYEFHEGETPDKSTKTQTENLFVVSNGVLSHFHTKQFFSEKVGPRRTWSYSPSNHAIFFHKSQHELQQVFLPKQRN